MPNYGSNETRKTPGTNSGFVRKPPAARVQQARPSVAMLSCAGSRLPINRMYICLLLFWLMKVVL